MAKWSRTRVRPVGAAAMSWREVTLSVRAGRLGRARSCAAGAVAAIAAVTAWAALTSASVHNDSGDPFLVDAMSRHLASAAWGFGSWAFLAAALAWHFAVERRRRGHAPARLPGDGWLAFGVLVVGSALAQASWPFAPVGSVDEVTRMYSAVPAAAAANAVIWFAVAGALAVLGVLSLTRRAERRDGTRLAWRALDREERGAA